MICILRITESDEFGNLPGSLKLTGDQVGDAFVTLRALMKTYHNLENSMLVGPDTGGMTGPAVDILTG